MTRKFTIATATLLLFALVAPQASAGDKDWANAGKVLAGVVGFGILHNALSSNHHGSHHRSRHSTTYYSSSRSYPSCRSTSYSYRPSYSYRHQPTYYQREVIRPVPTPVYHTTTVVRESAPVYRPAPAPVYVPAAPAPAPTVSGSNPVVVPLENGRRLLQPRIKGHVAYLQVYSEHSGSWVTLKEYPSLY
ncbi:MAG: hypothetical protein ACI8W8_001585 [Rhodothermales bacterium]|jgi:hypothetical protein